MSEIIFQLTDDQVDAGTRPARPEHPALFLGKGQPRARSMALRVPPAGLDSLYVRTGEALKIILAVSALCTTMMMQVLFRTIGVL